MEGGGALAALEAMKAHPKEVGVQVGTEEVGEAEARHAGEGPDGGPPSPCPHSHHGPSLVGSYSFPAPIVLQLYAILQSILSLLLYSVFDLSL